MKDYTFVDIHKVIKTDSDAMKDIKILAHTSDNKKSETLQEHTICCVKYFKRLAKDRRLEDIFDNFIRNFFDVNEEKSKHLFKKLLSFMTLGKLIRLIKED